MTAKEGYILASEHLEKVFKEPSFLISCYDYGDWWAYSFCAQPYEPGELYAGGYTTVNKKTGEIGGVGSAEGWKMINCPKIPNEEVTGNA